MRLKKKPLIIFTLISIMSPFVLGEEAPLWTPRIELEAKMGSKRDIGKAKLFLPLTQNEESLLFVDLRGHTTNNSSNEFNAGLGYRSIFSDDVILGGYGFFDHSKTQNNNNFNQATLGIEVLTPTWDARINTYIPVGVKSHSLPRSDSWKLDSGKITFREGQEVSMKGIDLEFGRALPLPSAMSGNSSLKGFLGAYHFIGHNAPDITGPRARLEYSVNKLPVLGTLSRLSIEGEYQHDSPRGSQAFFNVKLSIPLGRQTERPLNSIKNRMTDFVIRDIDIVSQEGAFGTEEIAQSSSTGKKLDNLVVITEAQRNDVASIINQIEDDKVVFINTNSKSTIETSETITLKSDQSLTGQLTAVSPSTGRQRSFGQGAHLSAINPTQDVLVLANNTSVEHLEITGGRHGVSGDGVENIILSDLDINNTAGAGINLEYSRNIAIQNNVISNLEKANSDGFSNGTPLSTITGVGIRLNNTDSIQIYDSHVETVGMGLFANKSNMLKAHNLAIYDTAQEGVVMHVVDDIDLSNLDVRKTNADGIAIVVGNNVSISNASVIDIGIDNIGQRSGINVSTFTADRTVDDISGYNSNFRFNDINIHNTSNAGLFLAGLDDVILKNVSIDTVQKSGIIHTNSTFSKMTDIVYDNVQIKNAGVSGISLNGPFENISGEAIVKESPHNCSMFSVYNAPSFQQELGKQFSINGSVVTTQNTQMLCPEAY